MPLIKGKSQKAFKKNVETEMESGKPQKQSLAIAYDIQRHAKKRKKMAEGGEAESDQPQSERSKRFFESFGENTKGKEGAQHQIVPMTIPEAKKRAGIYGAGIEKYAQGGSVYGKKSENTEEPHNVHPGAKKHYMKPSEHEIMSDKFPKGHVGPHNDSEDAPAEAEYLGVDATGRHRFAVGGKVITAIGRENYPSIKESEYDSDSEHFAKGGHVEDEHSQHPEHFLDEEESEVEHEEHEFDEDHPKSIADAVMRKMKRKHLAKGGKVSHEDEQVDLEANNHEGPGTDQSYNIKAKNKNVYDDSQLKKQPHDSNEHGDSREEHEENEDDADMISKIRHKMKKRGY